MPTRVYQYWCRPPTAGAEQAIDQMRRRVAFWNLLVELERAHQLAIETVLAEQAPGTEAAARPPAEASDDVRTAYRQQRRAAFQVPAIRSALDKLEAARRSDVKRLQAESGLWWCNYDDVLRAYNTARRQPGELAFHSWFREHGKVGVRYQTGLSHERLFGTDTRSQLQIVPPPPDAAGKARRRSYTRAVARVRVGSEGRAPIWLELPLQYHRPLPEDGTIRQVSVIRETVGTHERWKILFVVATPDPVEPPDTNNKPMAGLNVGWRVRPDGLRVGVTLDSAGRQEEIILPESWRRQMQKCDDIRSIRDQAFNAARDALVNSLPKLPNVPEWLREQTATLPLWRSSQRLARLVSRWRAERFEGDDAVFAAAEHWRKRERHLLEYEANLRDQLILQRREIYRVAAARIARTCRVVRLHAFDLRPVARRGKAGQADDLPEAVRLNRTRAATSTLVLALTNACDRERVPVVRVPKDVPITQTCAACGVRERFDAAAELEHTCTGCGARWDQDVNACRNLLSWTPATPDPDITSQEVCDGDSLALLRDHQKSA